MKKLVLLLFVLQVAFSQYRILGPLYLTKSRADTVTGRFDISSITTGRNWKFKDADGTVLLNQDSTTFRTFSDLKYWAKANLDTANRWAPKGTYAFPSDTSTIPTRTHVWTATQYFRTVKSGSTTPFIVSRSTTLDTTSANYSASAYLGGIANGAPMNYPNGYVGFNLGFDGTYFRSYNDGASNGSSMIYGDRDAKLYFVPIANTGASNRVFTAADIYSKIKMTLDNTGLLTLAGNFTNSASSGTITTTKVTSPLVISDTTRGKTRFNYVDSLLIPRHGLLAYRSNDTFDTLYAPVVSITHNAPLFRQSSSLLDDYYSFIGVSEDSRIALISKNEGAHGSAVELIESNNTTANLTDKWTMVRNTSSSSSLLRFMYGTSKDYTVNGVKFEIDTNANTYTYGDGYIYGGDLITNQATFNLLTSTVGTVNMGKSTDSTSNFVMKGSISSYNRSGNTSRFMVDGSTSPITSTVYSTSLTAGGSIFERYNGRPNAPSAVTSGFVLGGIFGMGYDGTSLGNNTGAVRMLANQTFTTSAHGTYIDMAVTEDNALARTSSWFLRRTNGRPEQTLGEAVAVGKGRNYLGDSLYLVSTLIADASLNFKNFTSLAIGNSSLDAGDLFVNKAGKPSIFIRDQTADNSGATYGTIRFWGSTSVVDTANPSVELMFLRHGAGATGDFIIANRNASSVTDEGWRFGFDKNLLVDGSQFLDSSRNVTAGTISSGAITSTGLSTFGTNAGRATIGAGDSVQVTVTGLTVATGSAAVSYKRTGATSVVVADTIASYNINVADKITLYGKYGWVVSYVIGVK